MPSQVLSAVENNFTKGLITEATGLNFPENAATSADNCIFTLIGDVTRRQGMDLEPNGVYITSTNANQANTCYKWTNVGGDGQTEIVVRQVGAGFGLSTAVENSGLKTGIENTLLKTGIATGLADAPTAIGAAGTLTRMAGLGVQSGSILGIQNFLSEALRQTGVKEFNPGQLVSQTAEGIGT